MKFLFSWITAFVLIGAGFSLCYWAPLSRTVLFPAPSIQALTVIDRSSGGNSWCNWRSDVSKLMFTYGLGKSAPYPFAGVKLRMNVNLDGVEALEIAMRADSGAAIRVALKSPAPKLNRPQDPSAMYYHEFEYEPTGADTLKRIPIAEFRFPRWWRIKEKWPTDQDLKQLHLVQEIEILSGFAQVQRDSIQCEIRSIVALRPAAWAFWVGGVLMSLGVTFLVLWLGPLLRGSKALVRQSLVGYRQVHIPNAAVELQARLVTHIKEHYQDSEYSLEQLARGVGVSERQASESVKVATGMHFKAALNEIRLTEAARLLQSATGNISEIAYAVGFNNHAHFTRAFKAKFGKSPSESRSE